MKKTIIGLTAMTFLVGGTQAMANDSFLKTISDNVEIGTVIEFEAGTVDSDVDGDSSDMELATVEVAIDGQMTEGLSGHLLLLYEEGGDDNFNVDEATITLGNDRYLTLGKMFVPFGSFASNMISDPLTLEMAETGETAALAGFETGAFSASVYLFNGDINETGEDDQIDTVGANLTYGFEQSGLSVALGADWISNIGDTDGIGDAIADRNIVDPEEIADQVGGMALHGSISTGPFCLIAEYITATNEFETGELADDGLGAQSAAAEPEALNLELAYTADIAGRETTIAVAFQSTDDAEDLGLPEEKYLASVGFGLNDYAGLAFEITGEEDYDDQETTTATAQLAIEF